MFTLFFDFIYNLCAVCKQSLQMHITILVSEQKYRDVRKRDHTYINDETLGLSFIFFLRKGGGGGW